MSQRFTHANEVIAMAPLSDDGSLFRKQQVSINHSSELQYDFMLLNGNEFHFIRDLALLRDDAELSEFKELILRRLKEESVN